MVKIVLNISWRWLILMLCALSLLSEVNMLQGQKTDYSYYYRVYFRDKGENVTENYSPEDLLSAKALARREKAGINVPDYSDVPVSREYIAQICAEGLVLHSTSKWMNSALFKSQSLHDLNSAQGLSFVQDIKVVKTPGIRKGYIDKLNFQIDQSDYPAYDLPVNMLNGSSLHNSGFNGSGILIAVLDGGFTNGESISSINSLRSRNGIKSTYDFVKDSGFVFDYSTHGTAVLSVLAGDIPGFIEGTAPGADYLLLRTEDTDSEFPCEEDFWVAGAEFADSSGADILTSSLGYYHFDDPSFNYNYSDLDGNTAFVTRAADIAASKGILVVNSAGNERTKEWKYIICPSDGDSVLSVGAVDDKNLISDFSSAGPSADNRIKPDNVAMGVNVTVQTSESTIGRASGTSFSCPVLSGMAACLMQAVPKSLNTDIIKALHETAHRFNTPDSLYGYGIPNIANALTALQELYTILPAQETIAGPNPTKGDIDITFRTPPGSLTVEIITMTGDLIFVKRYSDYAGRTLKITELQNREQGIYFVRLTCPSGIVLHKIIKLRN